MNYYQLKAITLFESLLSWTLFMIVLVGVMQAHSSALQSLRKTYQYEMSYVAKLNQEERKIMLESRA